MARVGDENQPTTTTDGIAALDQIAQARARREQADARLGGEPAARTTSSPDPDAAIHLSANFDIDALLDEGTEQRPGANGDQAVRAEGPVGANRDAAAVIDAPADRSGESEDPVRERIRSHHRRSAEAQPTRPPGTADRPPAPIRPEILNTGSRSHPPRARRRLRPWKLAAAFVPLGVVLLVLLGQSSHPTPRPPRPAGTARSPHTLQLARAAAEAQLLDTQTATVLDHAAKLTSASITTVAHSANRVRVRLERQRRERLARARAQAARARAAQTAAAAPAPTPAPASGVSAGTSTPIATPTAQPSSGAETSGSSGGGSSSSSSGGGSRLPPGPTGVGSAGNNCNPKCH